jgi:hypothetical protein
VIGAIYFSGSICGISSIEQAPQKYQAGRGGGGGGGVNKHE